MHTDAPARKAGRLSREDQRRLGEILKRVYDDVLRQGVPDRFKALLNEMDQDKQGGEHPASSIHDPKEGPSERQTDHFAEAERGGGQKGLASNKGSH
jgi:hypothetical protein